jgi:transcriptional regulator with XRE-family HTH domain
MAAHAADGRPDLPEEQSGDSAAPAEQTINPLQRLIQERLRARGWSYGVVARRGGLPRSTVYTLATTRNLARPPRPATIDALARGLEVPVSVVRTAAAESTGLHYYDEPAAGQREPDDRERELLIASIDELSPDDRRHVAALVESLRNRAVPDQQIRLRRMASVRDFCGGYQPRNWPWMVQKAASAATTARPVPVARRRRTGRPAGQRRPRMATCRASFVTI